MKRLLFVGDDWAEAAAGHDQGVAKQPPVWRQLPVMPRWAASDHAHVNGGQQSSMVHECDAIKAPDGQVVRLSHKIHLGSEDRTSAIRSTVAR
jgi:hypothetical protein